MTIFRLIINIWTDSGQQIIVYKFKRNSPIPVIVHWAHILSVPIIAQKILFLPRKTAKNKAQLQTRLNCVIVSWCTCYQKVACPPIQVHSGTDYCALRLKPNEWCPITWNRWQQGNLLYNHDKTSMLLRHYFFIDWVKQSLRFLFFPSPFKHLPSDFRCHSLVPVTFLRNGSSLSLSLLHLDS